MRQRPDLLEASGHKEIHLSFRCKVISCMSEYLLLVSEALTTEQFENCTVVSHRNHWPTMGELQRHATRQPCSFVALTGATDANSVRQMIRLLTDPDLASSDRRLIFADDAVPRDLAAAFSGPLSSLMRRVVPSDLMCLSTTAVEQAAATDTMLAAVFRGEVRSSVVAAWPSVNRFPSAGPGNGEGKSELAPDVLESAVNEALAGTKLTSAERKCVTSGILLLWDLLHASHEISQTMEGRGTPRTADYWHAIMHRREPDAGNAAYWFRRVGSHPAFDVLTANIERWMVETGASDEERNLARQTVLLNGQFDSSAMIELSGQALRKPGQLEDRTLRRIQYFEILNLLAWSMGTVSSVVYSARS